MVFFIFICYKGVDPPLFPTPFIACLIIQVRNTSSLVGGGGGRKGEGMFVQGDVQMVFDWDDFLSTDPLFLIK